MKLVVGPAAAEYMSAEAPDGVRVRLQTRSVKSIQATVTGRALQPGEELTVTYGDTSSGGTHEGAALALLDTAGAMAGWAQVGPGPYKASTPTMQAQVLAAPPAQDLIAYARVAWQDNEILYSDVEVAGKDDQRVYARGCIPYRIVT